MSILPNLSTNSMHWHSDVIPSKFKQKYTDPTVVMNILKLKPRDFTKIIRLSVKNQNLRVFAIDKQARRQKRVQKEIYTHQLT